MNGNVGLVYTNSIIHYLHFTSLLRRISDLLSSIALFVFHLSSLLSYFSCALGLFCFCFCFCFCETGEKRGGNDGILCCEGDWEEKGREA